MLPVQTASKGQWGDLEFQKLRGHLLAEHWMEYNWLILLILLCFQEWDGEIKGNSSSLCIKEENTFSTLLSKRIVEQVSASDLAQDKIIIFSKRFSLFLTSYFLSTKLWSNYSFYMITTFECSKYVRTYCIVNTGMLGQWGLTQRSGVKFSLFPISPVTSLPDMAGLKLRKILKT